MAMLLLFLKNIEKRHKRILIRAWKSSAVDGSDLTGLGIAAIIMAQNIQLCAGIVPVYIFTSVAMGWQRC